MSFCLLYLRKIIPICFLKGWLNPPFEKKTSKFGDAYCWWFRNPIPNHLWCIKPCKSWDLNYLFTSTGEFTGFSTAIPRLHAMPATLGGLSCTMRAWHTSCKDNWVQHATWRRSRPNAGPLSTRLQQNPGGHFCCRKLARGMYRLFLSKDRRWIYSLRIRRYVLRFRDFP